MTISVVLTDANILFSRTLRDYVLYAADEGAIGVHWSSQVLAEMSRNLRQNLGLSQASTSRLEHLMNDYIEYALVEVDPVHLAAVEAVEMDAKDRHVLAAALSADADILLTDNIKDFPAQWMAGQGIELLTAGQLLTRLAEDFPTRCGQPTRRPCATRPSPKLPFWSPLRRPPASTPRTQSARSPSRAPDVDLRLACLKRPRGSARHGQAALCQLVWTNRPQVSAPIQHGAGKRREITGTGHSRHENGPLNSASDGPFPSQNNLRIRSSAP